MAIAKLSQADFVRSYYSDEFSAYVKKLEPHFKAVEAQWVEFEKDIDAEAKAAKAREDGYKKINMTYFRVFKLRNGVSDVLKAKCLPLIKETQNTILNAKIYMKQVHNEASNAMTYISFLKNQRGLPSLMEQAVNSWNQGVVGWEAAEKVAWAKVEMAKAKEKKATEVFDRYLKDKQAMRDLGGDDYKAFKKQYEAIAKTL